MDNCRNYMAQSQQSMFNKLGQSSNNGLTRSAKYLNSELKHKTPSRKNDLIAI